MQGFSARVLGPVEVAFADRPIAVPTGRQRVLLAALLLNANEIVPAEELVELVWGEDGPARPRGALHTYMARLRQRFEAHHAGLSRLIRTTAGGYLIEVDPDKFDLARFRGLVRAARDAGEQGEPGAAAAILKNALSLWRGPALCDVQGHVSHWHAVPKLNEELLDALERLHDVMLALELHDEIIGELRVLVRKHPFRERFWEQLIRALYRADRRVEALQAFGDLSAYLRDELGLDPGQKLQRLHLAILRNSAV